MWFLRDTANPEGDVRRGWSGHACCWYATELDAIEHQRRNGTRDPKQCPVSGRWNADPETGLSGYGFDDPVSYAAAARRIESYVCGEDVAVFRSDDWDPGAGAEGEDCFRDAVFVAMVSIGAAWEEVAAAVGSSAAPGLR
jgi:hypothetical protein